MITQQEYQELVKRAYEGKILLGVDRALARKVYTNLSLAKIREFTGETPYFEKAVVLFAFVGGPLLALISAVLAVASFHWWAFLIVPACLGVWLVYKGVSSRGNAGMVFISLALAGSFAAYFAHLMPTKLAGIFLISFVAALWCERLVYCAGSFFLRAFVLRNIKAFNTFNEGLSIVSDKGGG
jgi:hypothetical protein